MSKKSDVEILERLFEAIEARKGGDSESSYTAKLFGKGLKKITQKLGEESAETIIAGLVEDDEALAGESADLLYHLLVLWSARGIKPEQVWAKLAEREGVSGLEEKKARKKGES